MGGHNPRSSRSQLRKFFILLFILTVVACTVTYFTSNLSMHTQMKWYVPMANKISHPLVDIQGSKIPPLGRGFVLSLNFYDQQASSLSRLLSLQCWAKELGNISVVEPFVIGSKIEVPLSMNSSLIQQQIKFSDLYDLHYWNPPLVSWKEFLHIAPRDVISVHITYDQQNCASKTTEYYRNYNTTFLVPHGFTVVSGICICQHCLGNLNTQQFYSLVFGEFAPNNVTVIFDGWRGITTKGFHTIGMNDSHCSTLSLKGRAAALATSEKSNVDARTYISQYFHGEEYNAIMVRLERVIRSPSGSDPGTVGACLEKVTNAWQRMKLKSHVNNTFVALDVGQFGSAGYQKFKNQCQLKYNITRYVDHFIKTIYGNSTTTEEWEQTFVNVSGTTKPGYIAALQKVITANAKCILLAGGGVFHTHTLNLYKRLHPQTQCIESA